MQLANSVSSTGKTHIYLLAVARDLNVNAVTSHQLVFQHDLKASSSVPFFARIIRKKGIIDAAVFTLKLGDAMIKKLPNSVVAQLGSQCNQLLLNFDSVLDNIAYPSHGEYTLHVDTINGSAAEVDIEIYGLGIK